MCIRDSLLDFLTGLCRGGANKKHTHLLAAQVIDPCNDTTAQHGARQTHWQQTVVCSTAFVACCCGSKEIGQSTRSPLAWQVGHRRPVLVVCVVHPVMISTSAIGQCRSLACLSQTALMQITSARAKRAKCMSPSLMQRLSRLWRNH
eukprot:15043293-Alexandrium_andersonii.AAC.1